MTPYLTIHARQRWHQRCTGSGPAADSLAGSILIPFRHAAPRWGHHPDTRKAARLGRKHLSYRVSAVSVWICRGRTAVTCLALSEQDLATVLTWLITGHWVE